MSDSSNPQYIGLMSGTSLDGIDGVRVCFPQGNVHANDHANIQVMQTAFVSYPEVLRKRFKKLYQTSHNELHESQVLAIEHSRLANQVVQELIAEVGSTPIVAIGDHGQTVRHQPNDEQAYSLQLGNGATLAELSGITTAMDFRNRDIAAGGQGAPLVPAFHQSVFSHPKQCRAIVNIGGIANITLLNPDTPDKPIGFDTGPGNTLMDEWAKQHLNKDYDKDGHFAKSGEINKELLKALMSEPFLKQLPPKSTGQGLFNLVWLRQFTEMKSVSPEDVQATLCEFTVQTILYAAQQFMPLSPDAIYVCGGGTKNNHLMTRLSHATSTDVFTTDKLGIAPQAVEACAFAWLAKQLIENKQANAPSTTGARHHVLLGAIYPN